ncbi:MAG: bifunctional riboflavin kinase/FAD synthetase [Clostridia bacterium]|nr:bifunctional riboflavin kinase/FAD synthetase [Clostridia bacterium]
MIKILDLQSEKEYFLSPDDRLSCAIGNFDGVHKGHQKLLSLAAEKREEITKSAIFTFSIPASHIKNGSSLLMLPKERYPLFRKLGIDLLILADFDEISSISPSNFAEDLLFRRCQVRRAVCGFNFRYGKDARGNTESLKKSFEALGGTIAVCPPYRFREQTVSSSEIREALAVGNPERALAMMGRPYSLTAEVVHGKRLGRTLGFPTANQKFQKGRTIPKFGVYAVRVRIDGNVYCGVANVGVRPTVENTVSANCETFVFDYHGDLYGKTITTEFYGFLRPERHFSDVQTLKSAVELDMQSAALYFQAEKEHTLYET